MLNLLRILKNIIFWLKTILLWLLCPILIGLIPVFLRFLVWHLLEEKSIDFLNNFDLIAFGLILTVHTFTQKKFSHDPEKVWDQIHLVSIIILIGAYVVFYTTSLLSQVNEISIKASTLTICCLASNSGSLLIGLITYIGTIRNER